MKNGGGNEQQYGWLKFCSVVPAYFINKSFGLQICFLEYSRVFSKTIWFVVKIVGSLLSEIIISLNESSESCL